VHSTIADSVKSKLQKVLGRNDGHATLCKISNILSGNGVTLEEHEPELNSSGVTFFRYVPVTSYDEVTTGDNFYLTT
jgi:hypothetical protein